MKTKPNEYDYFQTLNLNIYIPDTERINLIADVVFDDLDLPNTNPRIAKEYLKVVILNLILNNSISKKLYTAVRMTLSAYNPKSRYNKNKVARKITDVIHSLHKASYIDLHLGFNDRLNPINSYLTKIKATPKLITITNKPKHKLEIASIGYRPDTETIIVREKKNNKNVDIEYEDTPEILNYRKLMADYNNLIHSTHIDVYGRKNNAGIMFGKQKQPIIISQNNKLVRRIFIKDEQKNLTMGRLYGGWWQSLNSEYRSRITFNGFPTVEVDYSGMGIRLLYDKFNKKMYEGDAYDLSLVGYKHRTHSMEDLRPLLKKCLMCMTNSKSRKQALEAVRKELREDTEGKYPRDIKIEQLIDAFAERHQPIKEYFYSSIGNLQYRMDSEIASYVIAYFLYGIKHRLPKYKITKNSKYIGKKSPLVHKPMLVLAIHDSFIIRADRHQNLQNVMEQAYISYMNISPETKIKTKKEKLEFSKAIYRKINTRTKKPVDNIYYKKNLTIDKKKEAIKKDTELLNRHKKFKSLFTTKAQYPPKVSKIKMLEYYSNEEPENYTLKNIPEKIRSIKK